MIDFFFGHPAAWFTAPALIGTIFFGIRMVTALIGLDADHTGVGEMGGMDVALPGGGIDTQDHFHTDPGDSFKVLSVQSLAAFLMGFGWAGLGSLRGSGWSEAASVLVGVVGGVAMVWLLGWLLRVVYDLQTSGNVSIGHAEGREGDVYVAVPEGGAGHGRVRVVVDGRERFFPAVSESGPLERGARVRIERVTDNRSVVVRRA